MVYLLGKLVGWLVYAVSLDYVVNRGDEIR